MGTQLSPGISEINGFQWVSGPKECKLTSPSPLLNKMIVLHAIKKISGFFTEYYSSHRTFFTTLNTI